jgi:hypothetical protein
MLRPGFLQIEGVVDGPVPPRTIVIKDDVWIDEVPVEMVPFDLRTPNSEFIVIARERTKLVGVERANASMLGPEHTH